MTITLSTAHDKRRRRTRHQVEQLDQQIFEVLAADHPQLTKGQRAMAVAMMFPEAEKRGRGNTKSLKINDFSEGYVRQARAVISSAPELVESVLTIRHVFYRVTNPRLPEPVEKSDQGYRAVQHRITEMRRAGILKYSWITDATRRGYHTHTYANGSHFLRSVASLYRADLWSQSDTYVEVWCESRSIAGVIEDDCRALAVSLYPAGGFSSISLAYQAAENINYHTDDGERSALIFYIGDYDPAGVLIDVSIERELRTHLHPNVSLAFGRIAITEEQIEEYDLPTKPRKPGDRRASHVRASVEAEAMPAHILRQLLVANIEEHLPVGALHVARVAERSEREHIERMASMFEGAR